MRRALSLLGLLGLLVFSVQPVWANSCPRLIKEGRELLTKAKLAKGEEDKLKALLDEAQKLHDDGSHGDSMKKANQVLDQLKKKS